MQKKRPCTVYEHSNSLNQPINSIVSSDCVFHRWGTEIVHHNSINEKQKTVGIVEFENGLIINVDSNKIKFNDK